MFGLKGKIKNQLELISIHIPKTAGTSFRNILKEHFGEESVVRFDIVGKEKVILVENKELKPNKLPAHIKVIHGHFNYIDLIEKLEIKKDVPVITWLRNPVERVISNYFYLAKRLKEELREEEKGLDILSKMQKSLIEYARLELNRNRMSKFLDGISLEEMKFVGVHEFFDEDLEYFGRLFGFEDIQTLEHNITGVKHKVCVEVAQEIESLNALDMGIYNKGIKLRGKRINKYL
ncbi:MAG: sulfotransferase family protein [Bacteroidales bacterium]|nr:sulfotransferase family protein [Bacteroidales bacterium]MCF6341742.1 sulfotransferase family protein [Bacteroidales bacterium]